MEALPANANIAVGDLGFTDLVQGIQGYQTFVNSLTKGETVEQAVTDANNKIAEIYPTLQVPPGQITPPQLVFTNVGVQGLCLVNCKVAPQ